jgi:hypothetical protein
MMVWDGQAHRDAELILPPSYHPGAPLTGPAYGRALDGGYHYARRHDRWVFRKGVEGDFRNYSFMRNLVKTVPTYAPEALAAGHRYIPPRANYLVCEAIFTITSSAAQAQASHRLRVFGGGFHDIGDDVLTPVLAGHGIGRAGYTPYGPQDSTYRVLCEVKFSNVVTGAICLASLEGFAEDTNAHTGVGYIFQFAACWWEVRG